MITGIVMASGFSRRMNRNKLLLTLGNEAIIERVIKAAKDSDIDDIILVYNNEDVKKLAEKHNIKTVFNERPDKGQSESMKIGINFACSETQGYMFIVGDQPFLDSRTINTLVKSFKEESCYIVAPVYNGKRGNPVIFSSHLKEKLLEVEGDKGGRKIIEECIKHTKLINIDNKAIGLDIDTWEEYQRIKNGDEKID
ncbi:molybdenum cofactor cytidylyltransferase [Brassicibacter mesophilus]|uniref:molybdenum cofactor cytidylyltransferase n=1 Tax=Brassicibacter mesophilus TaxID=745119 RepID=UPI003D222A72